jgi:predicted nucleic acid-binding protein
MPYLIDTNVLSELRKGSRCHPNVKRWAHTALAERNRVSVLSLGEIRKGIELLRKKSPHQCPAFESWLFRLQTEYENDIIPVTETIADRWGRLMAAKSLPVLDGLLAATALEYKLTIATRNTSDFKHAGVDVLNPFD